MLTRKNSPIEQHRRRVFEDILLHFKDAIKKGELKPGDWLSTERVLASEFGVSRASLREALRALEMLGLLSITPGKGARVLAPDTNSISAFFELTLSVRPTFSENILEVRVGIECEAVRLACKRGSREELANIVGTATESVIRLLSEFKSDKLIELNGRRIKILNNKELEKIRKKALTLARANDWIILDADRTVNEIHKDIREHIIRYTKNSS